MSLIEPWSLRCPHCGRADSFARLPILRLGAASLGKRVLWWCVQCRRPRWGLVVRGDDRS